MKKLVLISIGFCFICLSAAQAFAAFEPYSQTVEVGNTVTVDFLLDPIDQVDFGPGIGAIEIEISGSTPPLTFNSAVPGPALGGPSNASVQVLSTTPPHLNVESTLSAAELVDLQTPSMPSFITISFTAADIGIANMNVKINRIYNADQDVIHEPNIDREGGIVTAGTADVWYVKPNGSDLNSGDSWNNALATIQKAMTISDSLDEIWVAAGTYDLSGPIYVDKGVDIYGGFLEGMTALGQRDWKNNVTVIDGQDYTRCLSVSADATIDGFTIRNADAGTAWGGGMSISGAIMPTIVNCTFASNTAQNGGGIAIGPYTIPTIKYCIFQGNTASNLGGGIYSMQSTATITNCIFSDNWASLDGGGGIANINSNPTITNCTFWGNIAFPAGSGDGIHNMYSMPTITNCILWNQVTGNPEIYDDGGSTSTVNYCNVDGGFSGTGNINSNPLFLDPANGDFHLQAGSPCIDAGDNAAVPPDVTTDFEGDPRIIDGDYDSTATVDMGADEYLEVDTQAPTAEMTEPSNTQSAPVDTNIVIHVRDSLSGVDQSTIKMTVDGVDVTPPPDGGPLDYTLTYALNLSEPPSKYERQVKVTVEAYDQAGNKMYEEFSFTTESYSGYPYDDGTDTDDDGISDYIENYIIKTNPNMKTLFVKPSTIGSGPGQDVYWEEFVTLLPLTPFVNAGIEIAVIGDDNNPYEPMREYTFDALDFDDPNTGTPIPCNILEIRYMGSTVYCPNNPHNEGHTYFDSSAKTWYWDTKGYTPSDKTKEENLSDKSWEDLYNWDKYQYFKAQIYPFALHNYFNEGAYPSIEVSQTPIATSGCGYPHCYDFSLFSPMNLNDDDFSQPAHLEANGNLENMTVEFNDITFNSDESINHIGAKASPNSRKEVLRRTVVHEMGHALLTAQGGKLGCTGENCLGDHCENPECIMYAGVSDWKLWDFGTNGNCEHKQGGSKDIRAKGVIHNTIHTSSQ